MSNLDSPFSADADRGTHMSFAENAAGEMVHVSEVARGLKSNCRCPGCGGRTIARQGAVRIWHFAHYRSTSCSSMTWLHRSAQEVLVQEHRITVPTYEQAIGQSQLVFSEVHKEFSVSSRRVDCLCVTEDGYEVAVEIRVTHEVDSSKLDDLRSASPDRDVMEIDLRPLQSRAPNWLELTKAVCEAPERITWLYAAREPQLESNEAVAEPRIDRRAMMAKLQSLISSGRIVPESRARGSGRRVPPGSGRRKRFRKRRGYRRKG